MDETAIIGIADHAGWAVMVTVAGGRLIDRRRVELIDADLPKLPHHHECQSLPIDEAVALVERVRASADRHAKASFDTIEADTGARIAGVTMRACPSIPSTIAERIRSYRAQNVADTVMCREALAAAAGARGWTVSWYDAKRVLEQADQTLIARTGASVGPPWQKDHRTAMAAAMVASKRG